MSSNLRIASGVQIWLLAAAEEAEGEVLRFLRSLEQCHPAGAVANPRQPDIWSAATAHFVVVWQVHEDYLECIRVHPLHEGLRSLFEGWAQWLPGLLRE
jgi:hypothetical protein